jgi:hypothetical protein
VSRVALLLVTLTALAPAVATNPSLLFWPDAAGAALAGAMTGRAVGPRSGFWNPAGIAFGRGIDLGLCARELEPYNWYGGIAACWHLPVRLAMMRGIALGIDATGVEHDGVPVTGPSGEDQGSYVPWEGIARIQVAAVLTGGIGIGASAGWLFDMVEPPWVFERAPNQGAPGGVRAQAFLGSAGLLWRVSDRASFGAAFTNFGGPLRYSPGPHTEPLPATVRLGGRWRVLQFDVFRVDLVPDLSLILPDRTGPLWDDLWKAVGVELTAWNLLSVRAGYLHAPSWGRDGFTYGFGLRYREYLHLEIADDRYLHGLGSRWWTFSATALGL